MEPEMIVFAVPILGILLGFFGVWTHHKQRLAKLELDTRKHSVGTSELSAQQVGQIRELQERVQVLERIVTDGGYDLAARIEALRDERPVAAASDIRTKERLS